MKTGIITGDPRKTCWKIYSYHGIIMRCRVSCQPPPVKPYPIKLPCPGWQETYLPSFDPSNPAKDGWVKVYDVLLTAPYYGRFYVPYDPDLFAGDKNFTRYGCAGWADGLYHPYAYDYDLYSISSYGMGFHISNCNQMASTSTSATHWHIHESRGIDRDYSYLFNIWKPNKNTHFKVYKNCGKP